MKNDAGISRNRFAYLFAAILVVAIGLASRHGDGLFPLVLGKYPGDALWTLMVFFCLGAFLPQCSTWRIAVYALAISFAVEISQLYQAPWINTIRDYSLGHLVLGAKFGWIDFLAYTVGAAVGVGFELLIRLSGLCRYSVKGQMKPSNREEYTYRLKSVFVAYLQAVSSASVLYTILFDIRYLISSGGFESSTTNDLSTKILHFLAMTMLLFILGWLYAFFLALTPFVIGIAAASKMKICHWLYFLLGGVITAAGLCYLNISIPNLGINVPYPEPPFLEQYIKALPLFISCGAIAGAVCWRYLRFRGMQ